MDNTKMTRGPSGVSERGETLRRLTHRVTDPDPEWELADYNVRSVLLCA